MITVVVTTRGRPRQVVGLIESARMLAHDPDGVRFVIGCDSDDSTHAFLEAHGYNDLSGVHVDVGPRPRTVTMVTNRAVTCVTTDLMVILGDDGVIATPDWDWIVEQYMGGIEQPSVRIAALNDRANPGQPTLFVLQKDWLKATHGQLFDVRFPFWFSDSALGETYSFILGEVMPILAIDVVGKPGAWNPRIRDCKLWWRFYAATRAERLATAASVRQRLSLPTPPTLDKMLELWRKRDAGGLPASEEIVRIIEASGRAIKPDDDYRAAKAAAEKYLATHAQTHGEEERTSERTSQSPHAQIWKAKAFTQT